MNDLLQGSPYQGAAVPLVSAYDVDSHTESEFQGVVTQFQKHPGKQLWPWIFINRIVGTDPARPSQDPGSPSNKSYFEAIHGMDLSNKTGALHDFCQLYRFSLSIAKTLNSPGIIIDPEVYNNYNLYGTSNLATAMGQTVAETEALLAALGSKLTDIANAEYPEATIWWLFTGLGESGPNQVINPASRTVTRIALGMLDRAKATQSKLKFVTGGEVDAGYCYLSLDDMKQRLTLRQQNYTTVLAQYPELSLGVTISPWDGSSPRQGWMTQDICGQSPIQNLDGFKPLFTYMIETYNHVWVYADPNAPYNPYEASASSYNVALSDSFQGIA